MKWHNKYYKGEDVPTKYNCDRYKFVRERKEFAFYPVNILDGGTTVWLQYYKLKEIKSFFSAEWILLIRYE